MMHEVSKLLEDAKLLAERCDADVYVTVEILSHKREETLILTGVEGRKGRHCVSGSLGRIERGLGKVDGS